MIAQDAPKFDTVMIIDDNMIDSYIISRMITKNNFGRNVLHYTDAQQAIAYLQANQYDVTKLPQIVFVDIYMPLMSGFEFLDAFDKLSADLKNHCRAYVISSTIDSDDIARSRTNSNVVSFHIKPITKEFLDRIV